MDEPVPVPIEDVLDLHTFQAREVKEIVLAYLEACRERKLLEVRIIHGKGAGHLCRSVRALLGRLPEVESFAEASALYGGSGATMVRLKPRTEPGPDPITPKTSA
jgi:DNA-nicking Smr family endonuclease